jgi:hypothetical protein
MSTVETAPAIHTPKPIPEEDRFKRPTFWLLLLFPFLYAGVGQLLRQDANFDLQNYHYFDPYWFLVNNMRDAAPAQLQTYFSPFLDIPFYFPAQHFPPRFTGSLLAVIQGTSFPLLYLINRHFTKNRWVALGLAGLGMFAAGALSEVGTIFGDNLVAPLFFVAILLGLQSFDAARSEKRFGPAALIVTASGLAGVAAGLKLAELPVALGIGAAFPLVSGTFAQRAQKALWAIAGLLLGGLLSYGWWGYEMTIRFRNPVLPYLNQYFHSPYAPVAGNVPPGVGAAELLFYPINWTLNPDIVGSPNFRELTLPIIDVLLLILLTIVVIRTAFRLPRIPVFRSEKRRYLVAMVVVSYVLWAHEFGQYRYFIPIEMLSFTLIFICLQAISDQIGWQLLTSVGTIALVLLCIVSEQVTNWGRSAWSATTFSVSVPKALRHQPAAFLMMGTAPESWVVPAFPRQDYFARIVSVNLDPTPQLRPIIVENVFAYRDAFAIWENPASPNPSITTKGPSITTQKLVEEYGVRIDWSACMEFAARVGALPEKFETCKLERVESLPSTKVVKPANGRRLVGAQYFLATASAPIEVRSVEFVIKGDGRTVNDTATPTLFGWLGGWKTTSVPNGTYVVHSVAVGYNGRVSASADVTVEVDN